MGSEVPRLEHLKLSRSRMTREGGAEAGNDSEAGIPFNLTSLELDRVERVDLRELTTSRNLRRLSLTRCQGVSGLEDLLAGARLSHLTVGRSRDMAVERILDDLGDLEFLALDAISLGKFPQRLKCTARLRRLLLSGDMGPIPLGDLEKVEDLRVRDTASPVQARKDGGSPNLRRLEFFRCGAVTSLEAVGRLPALTTLDLDQCGKLATLGGHGKLPSLEYVRLTDCKELRDISSLASSSRLRELELRYCDQVVSMPSLKSCRRLRLVLYDGDRSLESLSWLASLPAIEEVVLGNCSGVRDFRAIGELRTLCYLYIKKNDHVEDVSFLPDAVSLEKVDLDGLSRLRSLKRLGNLPNLRVLSIGRCDALGDMSGLSGVNHLEELSLESCANLKSIDAVAELRTLRDLSITDCPNVGSLLPLAALKGALRRLAISGMAKHAAEVEELRKRLDGCEVISW